MEFSEYNRLTSTNVREVEIKITASQPVSFITCYNFLDINFLLRKYVFLP